MPNVLSIDPGYKGGLVLLSEKGILDYALMPISSIKKNNKVINFLNEDCLLELITKWDKTYSIDEVVIEKQMVIAGQGIISSGKIKEQYGFLKGLTKGIKLPFSIVDCKTWQQIIPSDLPIDKDFADLKIKDTKKRSLTYCKLTFPELNLFNKNNRVLDGLSDAANMGKYFLERLSKKENTSILAA
jgi:hypothetical protein